MAVEFSGRRWVKGNGFEQTTTSYKPEREGD